MKEWYCIFFQERQLPQQSLYGSIFHRSPHDGSSLEALWQGDHCPQWFPNRLPLQQTMLSGPQHWQARMEVESHSHYSVFYFLGDRSRIDEIHCHSKRAGHNEQKALQKILPEDDLKNRFQPIYLFF